MLQQYVVSEDTHKFESRVRPYVTQVLMVFLSILHNNNNNFYLF